MNLPEEPSTRPWDGEDPPNLDPLEWGADVTVFTSDTDAEGPDQFEATVVQASVAGLTYKRTSETGVVEFVFQPWRVIDAVTVRYGSRPTGE